MDKKQFTHIGVEAETQRKVAMLARALDVNIYSLVEYWAEQEWKSAIQAGLVTNAMIGKKSNKSISVKKSFTGVKA